MDYSKVCKEVTHKYYNERLCIREIKDVVVKFLEHNKGYVFNEIKQYKTKIEACKDEYELFQVEQEQIPIRCVDFEQSYLVGCLAYIMSSLEYNLYTVLVKHKRKKINKPTKNILINLMNRIDKKLSNSLQEQFDNIVIISQIRNSFIHNGGDTDNLSKKVITFILDKTDIIRIVNNANGQKVIMLTNLFILYTATHTEKFFLELTNYLVDRTKH